MPKTYTFEIERLDQRQPGVTQSVAGLFYEAASVCLDRHHTSPVTFTVFRGEKSCEGVTAWTAPDAKTKGAYANETDTTEWGAYCVALVAIQTTDGLVAVRRAEGLTGADYYLGQPEEVFEDLEESHRLEVSGVDRGGSTALRSRLGLKVRQLKDGKSNLPAIAVVVGFAATTVLTQDVEAE